MGAPALINFAHFLVVPIASFFVVLSAKTRDQKQIGLIKRMIFGLVFLLIGTIASAILNDAGLINCVLQFLLLGEPLIFLLAIISLSMSPKSADRFRTSILILAASNLLLALVQNYILHYQNLRSVAGQDMIQGVFFFSGAGHVVSGSVSMTFGAYYLITAKTCPLWFRITVFCATVLQVIVSDTKQVFLVFFVAFILLVLSKLKHALKAIQYVISIVLLFAIFNWLIHSSLYENKEIIYWLDNPDLISEGIDLKLSGFSTILSYYHSPLNWLFGLGPGHTVGRLGGWMINDYYDLLKPLGVTKSPASDAVWATVTASPVGDKSSMWSPLVGWIGIWGDLGFLGLAAYLFICYLIWRYFCIDDISKFILITIVVFGTIFTQMEEPGYMLFVLSLIGIRWQEQQSRLEAHRVRAKQRQIAYSVLDLSG